MFRCTGLGFLQCWCCWPVPLLWGFLCCFFVSFHFVIIVILSLLLCLALYYYVFILLVSCYLFLSGLLVTGINLGLA